MNRDITPAERIHRKMIDKKWNIARLARESGVESSVISRIISFDRDLKATTLAKLATALRCSSDELLGINVEFDDNKLERAKKLVDKLDNLLWGK